MNNLQFWENQRLIKELQFVESDFYYLEEMIKSANPLFLKSIDDMMNSIPEVKDILKPKSNQQQEEVIEDFTQNKDEQIDIKRVETDSNIKNLYRQIVKKTHPDKVSNLESIYIEATKAYETHDISTILQISWDLEIPFEMTDEYRNEIIDKINDLKSKREFLENSLTYKWLKADDRSKQLIIVEYLKNKMFV
jgi:hypothetical protein